MGSSDTAASTKPPKTSQEQVTVSSAAVTPATPVYPDWSNFQAYSLIPPHGYFHSPVASSPQGHPYMWGAQHLMPPYGTPPHPYIMYPPGLYAHPSMPLGSHPFSPYSMASPNGNPDASGATGAGTEVDGKSSEGKERSPMKKSKGSLGGLNMITGKNEPGKAPGQPANEILSQSGESGCESSSERSDANSQNDSQQKSGGGHDSFNDNCKSGNAGGVSQNGLTKIPSQAIYSQTTALMSLPPAAAAAAALGVAGPTTNLNIGIDYWSAANQSSVGLVRGKIPATADGGAVVPGAPSELWLKDERELKRQRRKQSNRESARRSRLRKQAECEELAQRAEQLKEENVSLRDELNHIRTEYEELVSQNTLLKEKIEGQSGADLSLEKTEKHCGGSSHTKEKSDDRAAGKSSPEHSGV